MNVLVCAINLLAICSRDGRFLSKTPNFSLLLLSIIAPISEAVSPWRVDVIVSDDSARGNFLSGKVISQVQSRKMNESTSTAGRWDGRSYNKKIWVDTKIHFCGCDKNKVAIHVAFRCSSKTISKSETMKKNFAATLASLSLKTFNWWSTWRFVCGNIFKDFRFIVGSQSLSSANVIFILRQVFLRLVSHANVPYNKSFKALSMSAYESLWLNRSITCPLLSTRNLAKFHSIDCGGFCCVKYWKMGCAPRPLTSTCK